MTARRAGWLLAAAVLFAVSLALFWPGVATYDTVAQYGQVLSGEYEDWHPPAMARLWALIAPIGPGAAPMLVIQLGLYWIGVGLLARRLGRRGGVVVAVGLLPLFLGWQGVVLKDAQLVGALLAAVGIVGWYRLAARRLPIAAVATVAVLLGYAVMVRANAVFAVVPLAAMLLPPGIGWRSRAVAVVAGIPVVIALSPIVNHRLLDAGSSGVERTQPIYDLAAIAVHSPPGATPFDGPAVARLRARHCVSPYFWDPLGDARHCAGTVAPLQEWAVPKLYAAWARAVLAHPLVYAAHRLAHLNSTERWLVAARWPGAQPPAASEANTIGLGNPGRFASWWQSLAGLIAETPLGWPIAWVMVALIVLPMTSDAPTERLARALLASALTLEASFAVLSIASDLRYHLWPMIATALAGVLAWRQPIPRASRLAVVALAVVLVAGTVARLVLPTPPQTYVGMLG